MNSLLVLHPFAFAFFVALVVSIFLLRRRSEKDDEIFSGTDGTVGSSPLAKSHSRTKSDTLAKSRGQRKKVNSAPLRVRTYATGSDLAGFLIAFLFLNSVIIALPFAALFSFAPIVRAKRRSEKLRSELQLLWPQIIDHIISGLQSGMSLAETLASLGFRGPEQTKMIFHKFGSDLVAGISFDIALISIKRFFDDPIADQVCEVLDFARGAGSRDTALTLRTLADFIRRDTSVRNEIAAKHGWIRNSATLAAIAPWILLIILASQPNTIKAYSSSSGVIVLLVGIVMTVVSYLWMERVGKLRDVPRVFAR